MYTYVYIADCIWNSNSLGITSRYELLGSAFSILYFIKGGMSQVRFATTTPVFRAAEAILQRWNDQDLRTIAHAHAGNSVHFMSLGHWQNQTNVEGRSIQPPKSGQSPRYFGEH